MTLKKQKFNDQELALLFQAFSKRLFVRPEEGDITSAPLNSGCCFYFNSSYYEKLKSDIQNAHVKGKFEESNAANEWNGLMITFLGAEDIVEIDAEKFNDYYSEVSTYWLS